LVITLEGVLASYEHHSANFEHVDFYEETEDDSDDDINPNNGGQEENLRTDHSRLKVAKPEKTVTRKKRKKAIVVYEEVP